jgi:hypothetical protein
VLSEREAASTEAPAPKGDPRLAQLRETCEPGTPVYVLIDPLISEPIETSANSNVSIAAATECRAEAWERTVIPIPLPATIDLAPACHPYLVALESADDPWLGGSFEIADAERLQAGVEGIAGEGVAFHRIGGWLHSSARARDIATALAESFLVRCTVAVKQRYQRLVDRRALGWARCVAGDARLRAVLGPVQRWTYLDAVGSLDEIHRLHESASQLMWLSPEWATFMQGGLVHQTMARYLGEISNRGLSTEPCSARELLLRAHTALAGAAAAQRRWPNWFARPQDQTAWGALTLLHGDISTSPHVLQVLEGSDPSVHTETLHGVVGQLNQLLMGTSAD